MARGRYKNWITPEGAEQIGAWAAAGLTDTEIASKIGVSRKTLYEWAKKYESLRDSLVRGKTRSNDEVEGALYRRCLGYTVPVKKLHKLRFIEYDDKTGRKISEHEELVEGTEEVHVEADVTAQKFWLTNRMPERWQTKVEFEGAVTGSLEDLIRRHNAGAGSD